MEAAWPQHRVLLGVLRLQKQHLRHHQRRHAVLDRTGDEDDALLQEARKNVVGPFAAVGLLDHHGHQVLHVGVDGISQTALPKAWRANESRRLAKTT
jgi:hypothetical protein